MRITLGFLIGWAVLFVSPTGSCLGPFFGKIVCSEAAR